MRAAWEGLHAALVDSVTTLEMNRQFNQARRATSELQPFTTVTSLLEFLASEIEGLEEKNAIYATQIRAVQACASWASLATSILWCGLWPGLDTVYRRQLRYFHHEPEELISLISVAFTTLVGQLDLQNVRRIAATLTRSTEREVARARQRQLAITARTGPLPALAPADVPTDAQEDGPAAALEGIPEGRSRVLGIPCGLPIDAQAAAIHRWLRAVIGDDAEIFLAIAVFDESPRDVAEHLGLSHVALRKRIQRIRTRLANSLSQLGPEVGIS